MCITKTPHRRRNDLKRSTGVGGLLDTVSQRTDVGFKMTRLGVNVMGLGYCYGSGLWFSIRVIVTESAPMCITREFTYLSASFLFSP